MDHELPYPQPELHNNIIKRPLRIHPEIEGLGTTVFKSMKKFEDKIAQVDAITGEKETFGRILQKSVRIALHMRANGIKPGDVITVCSNNHLDTFIPHLASWMLGACVASVVPQLSVSEAVFLLKQVCPKVIFVSFEGIELIEKTIEQGQLLSEIVVFGKTDKYASFQDFISPIEGEDTFIPFKINNVKDTALIVFSSGTTGTPKGICIHHAGILLCLLQEGLSPIEFVYMTSSAPYWISATVFLMRSIISGSTRIVIPQFDPFKVWEWIKTYKVTFVFFATAQWVTLLKYGLPDSADISNLKLACIGGSFISKDQMFTLKKMLPNVIVLNGYGMSEAGGIGFSLIPLTDPIHLKILKENPQSLGRSPFGTECKVVDIETEETLGPNNVGELRIRSEFSMNGYYNLDSSDAWDSERFLKTGDLVYYDEDLCFFYVERIKEMLKYRSWQIAPVQIEAVLLTHPSIRNAIVVGIHSPEDGDHPLAIVELHKPATEEEIRNFVDERVSDWCKLRGGVKFIDEIPLTQTGKNRRMYVKKLLREGKI